MNTYTLLLFQFYIENGLIACLKSYIIQLSCNKNQGRSPYMTLIYFKTLLRLPKI